MCESWMKEVAGSKGPGLVGQHTEGLSTGKWLTMHRKSLLLGGTVSPE